jgi:lysophospholipase L1-like esterase
VSVVDTIISLNKEAEIGQLEAGAAVVVGTPIPDQEISEVEVTEAGVERATELQEDIISEWNELNLDTPLSTPALSLAALDGHSIARVYDLKSVRILLLGDSLTVGMVSLSRETHPYADAFKAMWNQTFPSIPLYVQIEAQAGECVSLGCISRSLIDRMNTLSISVKSAPQNGFDFVIVLGGTNDLGRRINPQIIGSGLINVGLTALQQGQPAHSPRLIMLTVPEVGGFFGSPRDNNRLEVNRIISDWCSPTVTLNDNNNNSSDDELAVAASLQSAIDNSPPSRTPSGIELAAAHNTGRSHAPLGRCMIVDTARIMRRHGLDKQIVNKLWSDMVHPSPLGYDKMVRNAKQNF